MKEYSPLDSKMKDAKNVGNSVSETPYKNFVIKEEQRGGNNWFRIYKKYDEAPIDSNTYASIEAAKREIDNTSKTSDKKPKNMRFRIKDDKLFMLKGAVRKTKDHGYVVNRIGDYSIIEGAGVDGGWWFAKEVRGKGKLETKKFKTRSQAEEHARMSDVKDESPFKTKDGPSPADTYNQIKSFSEMALQGYARRVGYPELSDLRNMNNERIIEEIISFLHGAAGERFLENPTNFKDSAKTKDEILYTLNNFRTTITKHAPNEYVVVKHGKYVGEFKTFQEAMNQIKDLIPGMAKDSDKDFALFYKSKLDEAIDSDDKEGMKRWSQELIDHYTTDKKTKDDAQVGQWKGFEIYWDGSYLYATTPNAGYKPIPREYWVPSTNGKRDMLAGSNGRQIKVNIEKYIDKLKGWDSDSELTIGKHDDVPDDQFDKDELAKGIEHEMEHTSDVEVAKSIAKDHLSENKSYYTMLEKLESMS